MANPSSRQGLIDYCLRQLGDPVVEINVDEDQLEDRVDEAIQYYREYHSDATVRTYLKHQVSAADVNNDYIIAEVYQVINPDTHTSVYNDMWLKEYTTALIKRQWGQNLIKFEGMQLPGGVMLNGRQIYDDAQSEIERLRENIRLEHELPPDFFVG
jgi:hypothetical protein